MLVPKHNTWDILDSTKTKSFIECPRSYFFRYLLGWRSDYPSNHLIYGDAFHKGMDIIMRGGTSSEAYEAFLKRYREALTPTTDDLFWPKTPEAAERAFREYKETYKDDDFELLYTEIAGIVPLEVGRNIHFRIDSIIEDSRGISVLEHKTAGVSGKQWKKWSEQWDLSTQIGTYNHALNCLYNPDKVWGVRINAISFCKRQWTEAKSNIEFMRFPSRRSPDMMSVWLHTINRWIDWIDYEMDELKNCKESDTVMRAFPINESACSKWSGCEYHDFCLSWANPLRHIEKTPIGYIVEWWNPAEKEAREIIDLTKKGEKNE